MANEKRMIDANALKFHYAKMLYPDGTASNGYHAFVTSVEVKDAPTVEAVEVVHGRWLKTKESLGWSEVDCVECSICHESWLSDEDDSFDYLEHWHYCPNCGADMRDKNE
jgi:hypothetical protein